MRRRAFLKTIFGLAAAMVLPAFCVTRRPKLTSATVNDLVTQTLRDLGKPKFTEIATDLQRLTAMRSLLRKQRVVLESGQWVGFECSPCTTLPTSV